MIKQFASLLCLICSISALGQCFNEVSFGSAVVSSFYEVVEIDDCNWQTEYATVTGIQVSHEYEFASSIGGYITIASGDPTGEIIAHGPSPLLVSPSNNSDLFIHWTINSECETQQMCFESTVLCVSCPFECPELGVNIGTPCDDLDPTTQFEVITEECGCVGSPILNAIDCESSTQHFSHCYGDNENAYWIFQTDAERTLHLEFLEGSIESQFVGDTLTIYDGATLDAPILWTNDEQLLSITEMSDIDIISTGSEIRMEYSSDNSWSCQYFKSPNSFFWEWEVSCVEIFDCDDLGLNIGEPCDDGSALTENDTVQENCECKGTSITTEVDCISPLQETYCYGNWESSYWVYEVEEGSRVSLSFISGVIKQPDRLKIYDGPLDTDPLIFNSQDLPSTFQTLDDVFVNATGKYLRMAISSGPSGSCQEGTSSLIGGWEWTVQCLPFDCENMSGYFGAPCSDGNIYTRNDIITEDCDCVGTPVDVNIECDTPHLQTYCYQNNDSTYWIYIGEEGNTLTLDFNLGSIGLFEDHLTIFDGPYTTDDTLYYSNHFSSPPPENWTTRNLTNLSVTSTGNVLRMGLRSDESFCCETNWELDDGWSWTVYCTEDCPILNLNIGDSCTDTNIHTINETVNENCECTSSEFECLNDFLWPPQNFELDGTTDTLLIESCLHFGDYSVFTNIETGNQYRFNASQTSYVTVRTGSVDGPIVLEGYLPIVYSAESDENIFIHWSLNESCEEQVQCYSAFVQCLTCSPFCETFDAHVGFPCDDGFIGSINETVQEDCSCVGTNIDYGCYNDNQSSNGFIFVDTSGEITAISDCSSENEYDVILNATPGYSYTFTSEGAGGFISVYSYSHDADLIGAGFSPLTVTAQEGTVLFVHWRNNENCFEDNANCVSTAVQCTSCAFDCPELNKNIGDFCDDGNAATINDIVTPECGCEGIPFAYEIDCQEVHEQEYCYFDNESGNFLYWNQNDGSLELKFENGQLADVNDYIEIYDGYSSGFPLLFSSQGVLDLSSIEVTSSSPWLFLSINSDENGSCHQSSNEYAWNWTVSCVEVDCEELNANIGDSCDDGNGNTIDDSITPNCTCEGTQSLSSLSGISTWNAACGQRQMDVYLYNVGSNHLLTTLNITISEEGQFYIEELPIGIFDIYLKVEGFLQYGQLSFELNPGQNSLNIPQMTSGDFNGDNGINIADFSIFNAAFNSSSGDLNYNILTDMNCDGGVNVVDFSMFNANFGLAGAEP